VDDAVNLLRIPPAGPATPLLALTAVSFDCEATGLDVRGGRILEIGAVALVNGEFRPDLQLSSLVSGAASIPDDSIRVHGITLDMISGAPDFTAAYKTWRAFSGRHILIGYAIDFDFALLAEECGRAGLAWKRPPALDVRRLVSALNPALPDHGLETVAEWLGITVVQRHRALADASTTAQVLLALVPRLRERGIRTLAEAWGACKETDGPGTVPAQSGRWQSYTMARADVFPYRHRVSEIMRAPPATTAAGAPLKAALADMMAQKVSSLFVEADSQARSTGILTERDILRAIAAGNGDSLLKPVRQHASYPLVTVRTHDFLYVAMGRMRRLRIRHLGVVDDAGQLVGALTQRDLLRLRADEALALSGALADSATVTELANVWRRLAEAAGALMDEDVDARDVAAIVSDEVCALTARAARMAEAEVAAQRPRPDGLSYAVMVLGSGGRGESLLALDQDNAMIFSCPDEAAAESWLAHVAARMNSILDTVGVPLCKGGVMARNAPWRHSTAAWRQQVQLWISRTDPADILNADIFFDAVAVHGDRELVEDLRTDAITAAAQSEAFLKLMSVAASTIEPATNWLGQFRSDERGRLDLKRLGLLPLVSAARTVALRHQIHERSSKSRLAALRGHPGVPQRQLEALLEAQGLLMEYTLRQQLADIENGISPSSGVDPKALSSLQQSHLRWALQQVKSVADIVGAPYP
jgi:DNA polymerase-3 subunit epsilon/CBS domain-containing protein